MHDRHTIATVGLVAGFLASIFFGMATWQAGEGSWLFAGVFVGLGILLLQWWFDAIMSSLR